MKRPLSSNPVQARLKSGKIETFNLMGFHPETGEELLPITSEVVEQFKTQRQQRQQVFERRQRPPQKIDPETHAFFDPATGEAQTWYWRSSNGDYEFYDSRGFHPQTGEALKLVDSTILAKWKREKQEVEAREIQERLRRERETQEQADRAERERRAASQRQQQEAQAGALCDQLAGNPSDPRRSSEVTGVRYEQLKAQATQAIDVCHLALSNFPDEIRYKYQYARALEISDPDKSIPLYRQLIRQNYPAAYDNLGNIYIRKRDMRTAISVLKSGVKANDPDSMVTLADLVGRGYLPVQNQVAAKYALLERAAQLGHAGAQLAVEQQKVELQQGQQERAFQQQEQQMMLDMFGTILRGVAR